jgi:hypothetical protein
MSREEDLIRSTTRAIASTVRQVPPLRLEADPDELWSHPPRHLRGGSGRQRRWRSWAAPLAGAAVITALAIALVLVKDIPNRSVVPANPAASAGPGGIPRYYVEIAGGGGPNALVVGDSLTGQMIASVPSPDGTLFQGVTAAADDRTFVVYAVTKSGGSAQTGSWYKVSLTPGTSNPARLTPLPIKPETIPLLTDSVAHGSHISFSVPRYGVFAMALSGSARELAVAEIPSAAGGLAVKVFSLDTGRLLHEWTTSDPAISVPLAWAQQAYILIQPSALSWIDGDRALALTTMNSGRESVRRLDVAGPTNGDLRTDSKVIWTTPAAGKTSDGAQAPTCGILIAARVRVFVPPLVSADGKTVSCSMVSQQATSSSDRWTVTFSTFQIAAGTTAAGQGTVAYQVTRQENGSSSGAGALGEGLPLWVSPSGGTLLAGWRMLSPAPVGAGQVHIGVISQGKFTPLPLLPGAPTYIVW